MVLLRQDVWSSRESTMTWMRDVAISLLPSQYLSVPLGFNYRWQEWTHFELNLWELWVFLSIFIIPFYGNDTAGGGAIIGGDNKEKGAWSPFLFVIEFLFDSTLADTSLHWRHVVLMWPQSCECRRNLPWRTYRGSCAWYSSRRFPNLGRKGHG